MKLHWSPKSPYVRKVTILLAETGLEDWVERVRSPVAITSVNPDVMRENPLNKIPVLVRDDGAPLYDSLVICLYLDDLHDRAKLVPTLAVDRIETLRIHALTNGLIDALILWRNERDRPEATRSHRHMEAYAQKVAAALAHLEAVEIDRLAPRPFDLGHITLGVALGYIDFRFAEMDWRAAQRKLAAWFEIFSARPSAKATAPVE